MCRKTSHELLPYHGMRVLLGIPWQQSALRGICALRFMVVRQPQHANGCNVCLSACRPDGGPASRVMIPMLCAPRGAEISNSMSTAGKGIPSACAQIRIPALGSRSSTIHDWVNPAGYCQPTSHPAPEQVPASGTSQEALFTIRPSYHRNIPAGAVLGRPLNTTIHEARPEWDKGLNEAPFGPTAGIWLLCSWSSINSITMVAKFCILYPLCKTDRVGCSPQ